jgi:PilZ domain
MSEFTNPFERELAEADLSDRRVWIRYPGNLETYCQPVAAETAPRTEGCWPASVWDVSTGGMALLVERRFEPGTSLLLLSAVNGLPRILSMDVIHASEHSSGHWMLGCVFPHPLTEEELHALWQDG